MGGEDDAAGCAECVACGVVCVDGGGVAVGTGCG